jgi:hypothetical protein
MFGDIQLAAKIWLDVNYSGTTPVFRLDVFSRSENFFLNSIRLFFI